MTFSRLHLLYLFLFAIGTLSIAQTKAPHKGQWGKMDSLMVELTYPSKKSPSFQLYIFDNDMNAISGNTIQSATITFYFTSDNTAMMSPRLLNKQTYLEATLEDWSDFHRCVIVLEINNIKHECTFRNNRYKSAVRQNNTGSDGHSGHTH
jgi:hypothetical protein